MNYLMKMFFLFSVSTTILFACKPKNNEVVMLEPPVKAEIALQEVSQDGCLNLEKLSTIFLNPNFSVPAAMMTTNLKALDELLPSKTKYFSYAAFNYKTISAHELGLFTQTRQKDCKTVQMLTASEEVMSFEIVSSNEKEISIKLLDKYKDSLNVTHKKALFERQQPYLMTYTYVSPTSLIITEKYRTVDPICVTKNQLNFEIRKEINWASLANNLPQSYSIDSQYLNNVKDSVMSESLTNPSALENPESVSVSTILAVMRTPVKDELKLCIQ